MSRALAPVVPPELAAMLARDPAESEGFTLLLLSVADGWPHQAMLSVGEVVALDERRLALALWPTSTSAAAVEAAGRATLTAVVGPTSYALRLRARRLTDLETPLAGTLACFAAEVDAVSADEAPYAELESGVRFRLHDPEPTFARWREVRSALVRAGAGR
ncbi:MAG: pyridoxamine 5'-phosphate oxidase family protein [Actinobacteria bacterium]|nr:pyridoxamine 5'-phosphate oxidase family protein [Actinomycetota bacterium]